MDDVRRALAKALGFENPEELPLALDVPAAGKAAYNLGRARSYAAAKDGSLPTVEIAGRLRVPTYALLKKLSGEAA
jgi:hypothetical protein